MAMREPSGKVSRSGAELRGVSPAEVRRLRDAALRNQRLAHYGTEYGRLFLEDKITAAMFMAAQRWCEMADAAHRALLSQGLPTHSPFAGGGHGMKADPDSDEGRKEAVRDQRTLERMDQALAILQGAGAQVVRAVRDICEDGNAPVGFQQIQALSVGLTKLSEFFGITAKAA